MSTGNFDISSWFALLSTIEFTDYLDIFIVTYLIYQVAKFFKNTRSVQVLQGIVLLIIFLQLSEMFKLTTINFILTNAMQVGLIALLIVFQPELRRAISKIGRINFSFMNFDEFRTKSLLENVVSAVAMAAKQLADKKIGALIVIERNTKILDIIRTGITLNADVTSELLINIFFPNAPLHDGAVVIGNGKVLAAGCFLPLSQNDSLESELGTRHRAGLGISEGSDCVSIIVSEETGKISIACDGGLTRNISAQVLKEALSKLFIKEEKKKKRTENREQKTGNN